MAFNFWHSTDKYVKPVDHKNGIGFVNIDIWGRFAGGGEQIPHMIVEFSRGKFNTIISRATNRAGEKFRTEILRKTAEQYYVKQKDIRDSLTLRRAYARNAFNFTLISKGKRRTISHYIQNPKKSDGRKLKQWEFAAAVKREGGLKKFRSAFFMQRDSATVYIRKGKYPEQVISPSIPQIVKNKRSVEYATIEAQKTFEKRLDYELLHQWGLNP